MNSHDTKNDRKIALLAESGQTDEERRAIRMNQRSLLHDIASDLGDEIEKPDSSGVYPTCSFFMRRVVVQRIEPLCWLINEPCVFYSSCRTLYCEEFDRCRDENNKSWKAVRFVREAVLDSDNLSLLSARAAKQTKRLEQVRRSLYRLWFAMAEARGFVDLRCFMVEECFRELSLWKYLGRTMVLVCFLLTLFETFFAV